MCVQLKCLRMLHMCMDLLTCKFTITHSSVVAYTPMNSWVRHTCVCVTLLWSSTISDKCRARKVYHLIKNNGTTTNYFACHLCMCKQHMCTQNYMQKLHTYVCCVLLKPAWLITLGSSLNLCINLQYHLCRCNISHA